MHGKGDPLHSTTATTKRIARHALVVAVFVALTGGIPVAHAARQQGLTPAFQMALHVNHEDALYDRAKALASRQAHVALPTGATASDAFDWKDALVGAGSSVAVLFIAAAAMVAFRRGRSRLVQSKRPPLYRLLLARTGAVALLRAFV
jgi:hypothetical protein